MNVAMAMNEDGDDDDDAGDEVIDVSRKMSPSLLPRVLPPVKSMSSGASTTSTSTTLPNSRKGGGGSTGTVDNIKAMELVKSLMLVGDDTTFPLESFSESSTIISSLHEIFFMYVEKSKTVGYKASGVDVWVDVPTSSSSSEKEGVASTSTSKEVSSSSSSGGTSGIMKTENLLDQANAEEPRMSDKAFHKFAMDFGITPTLIAEEELAIVCQVAGNDAETPGTIGTM